MADPMDVVRAVDQGGVMVQDRFTTFLLQFASVVEAADEAYSQREYRQAVWLLRLFLCASCCWRCCH
jgi:hypothetical protein